MPTPLQLLRHHFFPRMCLGCERPLWEGSRVGLCIRCFGALVHWPRSTCASCGRAILGVIPNGFRCSRCYERAPGWHQALSTWVYQPPLDAVIRALKFRRLEYLAADLGRLALAELSVPLEGYDVVTPIPLYWSRHLARGFDQSELIARAIGCQLGLPVEKLLRRCRKTAKQSSLPRRARAKNVHRAFAVRRFCSIQGRSVVLVDDVMTTGATAGAAAAALRRAGAGRITVLTVARAPDMS